MLGRFFPRELVALLAVGAVCVSGLLAGAPVAIAQTQAAPNYQGLWWAAPAGSESGWGINFAHQGDIIFASWFTYDVAGKGMWLVMTAPQSAPNTYAGTLYSTTGPAFNAVPFVPAQVVATAVGTGTLTFTDTNDGSFAYTVNGTSQLKSITREVFGTLPNCATATGSLAAATNYTDLWWAAPAGAESGWGINLSHEGSIIFATWFTYALNGTPMWLVVTASQTSPGVYAGTLYQTTGPAFNAVPFNPANVLATAVGNASFSFSDGNNAMFSYTVNGISQTKAITREVFQAPGTVCQEPASGTAEGLWRGTTSADQTALGIVMDDGTYYLLYSRSGGAGDAGVVQGSSMELNGALTSPDGLDFPIQYGDTFGEWVPATVSGTYVPRASLQLTIGEGSGSRTVSASYDPDYDHPASLAAAAGTYVGLSGSVNGATCATFTLDANGNVSGSNCADCGFQGTITPHKSVNVFDWSVKVIGGCPPGGATVTGILYYDQAAGQIHAFAPCRSDVDACVTHLDNEQAALYYWIGTKQ